MLRLTISGWSKLGTQSLRQFLCASILLCGVAVTASAATTQLPDAVNGASYSVQLDFPLRLVNPITVRITSGTLPSNLTVSANGLISGTPAINADHDYKIK